MASDAIYSCDQTQDSCPDIEGLDPVTNFMNYSNCQNTFTPGQAERAYFITETYHPGLLENEFYYPNLGFASVETFGDTDSDGVINPGEISNLKIDFLVPKFLKLHQILQVLNFHRNNLQDLHSYHPLLLRNVNEGLWIFLYFRQNQ